MRKFKMGKLVRDRIVKNILKNKKSKVEYVILDDESFLKSLKDKFYEELEEFSLSDKKEIKNELADLQLILDYFLKILKISKKELKKISNIKNQKVGKFDKKIFLKTVEVDDDDRWIEYYKKRYEEIK